MAIATCAHQVQFYGDSDPLDTNVSSFLAVPLLRGEAAIVIATREHREAYAAELTSVGLDVERLRRQGRYLELDAAETLATFMTDTGPDPDSFRTSVGGVAAAAVEEFGALSAYGEMVGLLAANGQMVAALQLETLWSELMREIPFRLLCGYPRESFETRTSQPAYDRVCAAHDGVAAIAMLSAAIDLPLGPEAGALARRAVQDVCRAWDLRDAEWLDDLALIATELVGNAVRHASSRVALSLDMHDERVTISVTDGSATVPVPRSAEQMAEDGRGFAIIDALTERWGVERQPQGKRVWVQLRRCPRHA